MSLGSPGRLHPEISEARAAAATTGMPVRERVGEAEHVLLLLEADPADRPGRDRPDLRLAVVLDGVQQGAGQGLGVLPRS